MQETLAPEKGGWRFVRMGAGVGLGRCCPEADGDLVDMQVDQLGDDLVGGEREIGRDRGEHVLLLDPLEGRHDLRVQEGLSAAGEPDPSSAEGRQIVDQAHQQLCWELLLLPASAWLLVTKQR